MKGTMRHPDGQTFDSFKGCVGPGWWPLLDRLVDDLFDLGWDGEVHQIKEKFGGLRFYIGYGSDEIFDRIERAEAESFKICEECGTRSNVETKGGWLLTLCGSCRRERDVEVSR